MQIFIKTVLITLILNAYLKIPYTFFSVLLGSHILDADNYLPIQY